MSRKEQILYIRFKNSLIKRGNKEFAENLFFNLLSELKVRTKQEPLGVVLGAIENVRPRISLQKKVAGGTSYMLPWIINEDKSYKKGIQWLLDSVKVRKEKDLQQRLLLEIEDSYNKRGITIKKKNEYHKKGWNNRAFIRYLRRKR